MRDSPHYHEDDFLEYLSVLSPSPSRAAMGTHLAKCEVCRKHLLDAAKFRLYFREKGFDNPRRHKAYSGGGAETFGLQMLDPFSPRSIAVLFLKALDGRALLRATEAVPAGAWLWLQFQHQEITGTVLSCSLQSGEYHLQIQLDAQGAGAGRGASTRA